ncbi:hypothetical protein FRC01_000144 [Tulasnella sp. 417]|nr:hypothetical protein FRC01_000144 [Tulasnella sp. 417]
MLPDLAAPDNRHATHPDGEAKAAPVQHRDLLVKARMTIAFLVLAIEAGLNVVTGSALTAEQDSGMKGDRRLISPTRELVTQIAAEALKLTRHHHHGVHLFVGGESKDREIRGFKRGRKDIVVTVPGRLLNVMESIPGILLLDEADARASAPTSSLSSNTVLPIPKRQTSLVSATVPPGGAIRDTARRSLDKHHTFINSVKEDDSPVHGHIPQYVTTSSKPPDKSKAMIFRNTTKMTALTRRDAMQDLRACLPQLRTMLYELHCGVTQNRRRLRSDDFRNDKSGAAVLVTSDVLARGVEYPNVTRVIQLSVPASPDQSSTALAERVAEATPHGDLVLLPFEKAYPRRCISADMYTGMFDEEAPELGDRMKGMLGFNKKSPQIGARERLRDPGSTPRGRQDNEWTSSAPRRLGERGGGSFEDRRRDDFKP